MNQAWLVTAFFFAHLSVILYGGGSAMVSVPASIYLFYSCKAKTFAALFSWFGV